MRAFSPGPLHLIIIDEDGTRDTPLETGQEQVIEIGATASLTLVDDSLARVTTILEVSSGDRVTFGGPPALEPFILTVPAEPSSSYAARTDCGATGTSTPVLAIPVFEDCLLEPSDITIVTPSGMLVVANVPVVAGGAQQVSGSYVAAGQ